jgi:hypothetical protein
VRRRNRLGGRNRLDEPAQTLLDRGRAGEVVEDALVDPERARRQRVPGELDEVPAPERAAGAERAPVRAGQRGEREPEGGMRVARVAVRRRARRGEGRVELDARAEQDDVALERREPERGAQRGERARLETLCCCLYLVDRGLVPGVPPQRLAQARELGGQRALIRRAPVDRLRDRRQIVTLGPNSGLAGSRSSGLSAPSTCTRTK